MKDKSQLAEVVPIFGDKMRNISMRLDGFVNFVTGLGTSRDKSMYTQFQRRGQMPLETLDALYSENDMAARICDTVPEEELRQGYDIVIAEGPDANSGARAQAAQIATEVHDAGDALDLTKAMIETRVWGRAFGGGAMLLGIDDGATVQNGRMVEPLAEDNITRFDHINVLDRRYMHPLKYYSDPTNKKFARPETYLVTPQASDGVAQIAAGSGTLEIHESRLVVFGSTRTTINTRQRNSGWDTSVLERVQTVLTQFGVSWDSLTHILQDASQAVFKMDGFLEALSGDEQGLLMKRMSLMDMTRSAVRAVILDTSSGEEFERQNFSWTGIKEPFQLLMLRLSAAARMPATVLMSQSPSGMDATGESDMRWWYDTIKTSQQNEVKPELERILRYIMLNKSGPTGGQVPDSWSVVFPSLWQPTPKEQSEIELNYARRDEIYLNRQVVTPIEVAMSRFTADGWRPDTQIDLDERRELLGEGDLDDDIENTPQLPGAPEPEGESLQSQSLAAGQTTALASIAVQVQNGTLTPESGAAIVSASNPELEEAQVTAIVGKPDPKKVAQREALSQAAKGEPAKPGQAKPQPKPGDKDKGQKPADKPGPVAPAGDGN